MPCDPAGGNGEGVNLQRNHSGGLAPEVLWQFPCSGQCRHRGPNWGPLPFGSCSALAAEPANGDRVVIQQPPNRKARDALAGRPFVRAPLQPVVVFHPTAADPVLCPREMIRVESGTVSFEGIALELDVPRNMPSEAWSLVRLSSGSTLRLRDCSLTIRNSTDDLKTYHQNVAFFRMVAATAPSVGLAAPPKLVAPAKLDLANCIVRGEASLVRFGGEMPLAFTWDNGLLATTEPVLLATGSDRAPAADAAFQVAWTHVTIATGQDLIRLAVDEFRPHADRSVRVGLCRFLPGQTTGSYLRSSIRCRCWQDPLARTG